MFRRIVLVTVALSILICGATLPHRSPVESVGQVAAGPLFEPNGLTTA